MDGEGENYTDPEGPPTKSSISQAAIDNVFNHDVENPDRADNRRNLLLLTFSGKTKRKA